MSWEQPTFSFGNPNAQPPTPTQTPTSGVFSSPIFQTPRPDTNSFEDHTGWTPTFAEEYSVFNATPGRLTNAGGPFADISTPRPSTASSHKGTYPNTQDIEAEIASHLHHSIQTDLPLLPVEPSRRLSSSPHDFSTHGPGSKDRQFLVTPRKPRRRLEEAFSGQTATPPESANKTSRKLAPKPAKVTMQHDQQSSQQSSGTPGMSNLVNFSSVSDQMYSYTMSAPATAPVFTNSKSFWDPDSSMSGMDMDMDFGTTNNPLFDSEVSQRMNTSLDWGRSNQIFQETVGMLPFNDNIAGTYRRQRAIAPQNPVSSAMPNMSDTAFSFATSTMPEDPFAVVASSGAVDPGLLFTFPEVNKSPEVDPASDANVMNSSQTSTNQMVREPYQHQRRESRRDQEELRRSRTSKETSTGPRYDRASFSSPSKKTSRPGLQRSASDSRAKIMPARRSGSLSNSAPRVSSAEIKGNANRRRSSPLKHQSRISLSSIPESISGTRTSLTFSIDANGRARTETKIIEEEPAAVQRRPSSSLSDEWPSSHSDSSTDEDPIIVPSRSTSFSLPPRRLEGPKLGRFDTYQQSIEGLTDGDQRRGFDSDSFSRGGQLEGQESEAETVVDDDDTSGDATTALRKIMESRKLGALHPGKSQHHIYSENPNRIASGHHFPRRESSQQYYHSSSSNLSPTTVSDPDLATPSTDRDSSRSDSTRCICNNRDGDGFMIQCESCEKWLHGNCVGVNRNRLPKVYICAFCAQTPNMRGGRIREPTRTVHQLASSPLAHKSFKSWR